MGPPPGTAGTGSRSSLATGPLLAARRLTCRFGDLEVLHDVDLEIHPGELVALVGENGAGKSSLIRCLVGALHPVRGTVSFEDRPLGALGPGAPSERMAVVWQDLALCDNLDVVANLFLGQEWGRPLLSDADMHREARRILSDLDIDIVDLARPVGLLSGGQRQMIAIARALVTRPKVLLLDEPTAALGVRATRHVDQLLRRLHRSGLSMLLVSHRMDQVFDLADRIVVLRRGRVVADVSPLEVHPDDVVDLMAGVQSESAARLQLHRLHSLVDQLAEVQPSASLPLIVSAIANALGQSQVCVHLVEDVDEAGTRCLVRRAAVNLPDALMAVTERLVVGAAGGPVGDAAARGHQVMVDDLRRLTGAPGIADAAASAGVVSAWAVPILGSDGLLGVVSGWSPTSGRLQREHVELVSLYAGYAAAAIERERLLEEVSRRNHILETLRGVLETLAGPEHLHGGLRIALLALARGLGADAAALLVELDGVLATRAVVTLGPDRIAPAVDRVAPAVDRATPEVEVIDRRLRQAAAVALAGPTGVERARLVGTDVVAVPFEVPGGRAVVAAWWPDPTVISGDSLDLLDDASRSVRLAIEREAREAANQEARALRRSQEHQREFLSRVSHELRTPLTAIRGYASSLNQTDVTWDEAVQHRFLGLIATESARMGRLVGDLLDSSALEVGVFRLSCDWCELPLVLGEALACVPGATDAVEVDIATDIGPVWGDHDRLEQVLVNLLENVARHGDGLRGARIDVRLAGAGDRVEIRVRDNGPGIPIVLAEAVFQPKVRGRTTASGDGLGLAISRGIVAAHGGELVIEPTDGGTTMLVVLPIEPDGGAEPDELAPGGDDDA